MLADDLEREEMMFRIMFNTAFIRSNILILNPDEVDTLWNAKEKFSGDFRAEVCNLLSTSQVICHVPCILTSAQYFSAFVDEGSFLRDEFLFFFCCT